eukprot:SAG22_NODE_1545_length_4156_cov_2.392162_3_plen_270_part_00
MTGPNGREPFKSTCLDFGGAASNHPLKGGKFSNFEGGVRAVSFMGGGFLPSHVRGTVSHSLIATADWLGTFATLAGVDPTDKRAAAYGLPPIDSVDQSPIILGSVITSHNLRQDIVLGGLLGRSEQGKPQGPRAIISARPMPMPSTADRDQDNTAGAPTLYKLLIGMSGANMATWSGPRFPNASSSAVSFGKIVQNCSHGCLYEVIGDPTEHHEISAAHPQIVAELRQRLEAAEAVAWIPERGTPMKEACDRMRYAGHYGPWLQLGEKL